MTVHTISALLQMGDDATPEATKGIIRAIGKRFACGKSPKQSTMQRAELHSTGTDGSVIALCFYGRDEVPQSMNGRLIYLTANSGGLKRSGREIDDGKGGKLIVPQLWVWAKAEIAEEEGAPAKEEPPRERPPVPTATQPPPPGTSATGGPARKPDPEIDKSVREVKGKAMQLGNLYALASLAARKAHDVASDETAFPATHIPQVATAIFIKLERDGMHTQLPAMPLNLK